jgi:glycogen(starch) synthase
MNIVHVTHRAWPVIGGSERYVQEVARRQVIDGHGVTIVATDADELSALWDSAGGRVEGRAPAEYQGVRILRLPVRYLPGGGVTFALWRRLTWLVSQVSVPAALVLGRRCPWVPCLSTALSDEPADLLFAWNLGLEGLTAAVADEAQRRRVPWLAIPLLHLGRPRFYTMRHQLALLRGASRIFTQTERERRFLMERGLNGDRVHTVSPGIDLDEAQRAEGSRFRRQHGIEGPVVLTLGALAHDKGTVHLLRAARAVWEEGRALTLVLIGPVEKGVEEALTELPAAHSGKWLHLKQVSEEEKWDALDAADMLAVPSRTESFGIVFLEAWARGKPVVGARAGAIEEVVNDGKNGLLVEFGDVRALADALRRLLDDPESARRMGQRGREEVQSQFTWDEQFGRLRSMVDRVMVERGR